MAGIFGGHILKQPVNTEALSFLWYPRDPASLPAAITPLLPIRWALMAQLWVHVKVTWQNHHACVCVCVPEGWGGGRCVRRISKYQNPDPALGKCHFLENKQKLRSQALYRNLLKTIWCQLDKGHIWHLQFLSDAARTNLLLALSFSRHTHVPEPSSHSSWEHQALPLPGLPHAGRPTSHVPRVLTLLITFRLKHHTGGYEIRYTIGLSRWHSGKEPTCQCRRLRFDPWVGNTPWSGKWQLTTVFLPGKSHGWTSLERCSSWDWKVGYDWAQHTQQEGCQSS